MTRLAVRPMAPSEAPSVVDYFLQCTHADLDRMGVPRSALPERQAWIQALHATISAGPSAGQHYTGWEVDGHLVGHCAVKRIQRGCADIHLHLWKPELRGKRFGAILFCLSVVDAYERLGLKSLVCEPRADNPMPNGLLRRLGFPLSRVYEGSSSELSAVTTLNRYDVRRDIAADYLARFPAQRSLAGSVDIADSSTS